MLLDKELTEFCVGKSFLSEKRKRRYNQIFVPKLEIATDEGVARAAFSFLAKMCFFVPPYFSYSMMEVFRVGPTRHHLSLSSVFDLE